MSGHGFGQQRARTHALPDVFQDRAEPGGCRAFREQVERPQYWQARTDESIELLIEYQEIGRTDLAVAACAAELRQNVELIADGEDVKPPFGELLPGFILGLRRLDLLEDPAGGIPDFAYEIGHSYLSARLSQRGDSRKV